MKQRKYILFVALVFTGFFASGQRYKPAPKDIGRVVNENKKWGTAASNAAGRYQYSAKNRDLKPVELNFALPLTSTVCLLAFTNPPIKKSPQEGFPMLEPNTYYDNLGFFCRKEIQLQRVTIVPVKFRLGSYDYVNWLEGKNYRP